jgi:hypothetical protein
MQGAVTKQLRRFVTTAGNNEGLAKQPLFTDHFITDHYAVTSIQVARKPSFKNNSYDSMSLTA